MFMNPFNVVLKQTHIFQIYKEERNLLLTIFLGTITLLLLILECSYSLHSICMLNFVPRFLGACGSMGGYSMSTTTYVASHAAFLPSYN